MTFKEQQERLETIKKAQAMFPDERNITVALQKYKDSTGDGIALFLNSKEINRALTPMDEYERIPCDECGADMMFRILPENEEGYKTQIVCSSSTCNNAMNSEYSLHDWMQVLTKKKEQNEP